LNKVIFVNNIIIGTILDRIDYNIEKAVDNTKKANEDLVVSEKNLEGNCARNAIIVLIILIGVLFLMLVIKFIS